MAKPSDISADTIRADLWIRLSGADERSPATVFYDPQKCHLSVFADMFVSPDAETSEASDSHEDEEVEIPLTGDPRIRWQMLSHLKQTTNAILPPLDQITWSYQPFDAIATFDTPRRPTPVSKTDYHPASKKDYQIDYEYGQSHLRVA